MSSKKQTGKWKKVAQIVVAYLVAAWTFLQFVDWTLIRYNISPHWVDLLLWIFIGILPSIILYLFNSERINKRDLKLREKIIFPFNTLLLGTFLFFFFGNSDLGSTTKEVSFTNELGNLETQTITKEEFRIGIPVFNFEQKKKDSIHSWLGNAINKLIKLDLDQDKNFTPGTSYADNTVDKVNRSSPFFKYYVDGEYEVKDSVYYLTPILRNAKNGKEIKRIDLKGSDFFSLIDQTTVFIKENLILTAEVRDKYLDLDIKDITTSSIKALEKWSKRNYEGAVEEDETFSLAYYYNAKRRNTFSQGELEEKYLIDKAYQYRSKLPSQLQYEILMLKHIVYNRWQDAEELIKYQLEISPNNESFNELLYRVYSETKNIDAYFKHASDRFNKSKDKYNAPKYFEALILKNEYDKAIKLVSTFDLLSPNNEEILRAKAYVYLISGDVDEAKKIFKKVNLLWPKESHYQRFIDSYIEEKKKGITYDFDIESSQGKYISSISEQHVEYFNKNNSLCIQYTNQTLGKAIVYNNNELLKLDPAWVSGTKHLFEKDSLGSVYRVKTNQFNRERSSTFYYYRETEEIRKAYQLLKSNKREGLKEVFEKLVAKYPMHWFLKDALQQVTYSEGISKKELQKQYQKIEGEYGSRKFWVENGRLYYKRNKLPKAEILPISKNRYINTSVLNTNYEFEFLKDGKIASFAWNYDEEKNQWVKLAGETNYLLKN